MTSRPTAPNRSPLWQAGASTQTPRTRRTGRTVRDVRRRGNRQWTGTGGLVAVPGGPCRRVPKTLSELEAAQASEEAELAAELEAAGYPERTQRAQLRRLEEREKRAHRRARTDALLEGICARGRLPQRTLAGAGLGAAQPRSRRRSRSCRRRPARSTPVAPRQALSGEFNPNEALLIERLLLHSAGSADRPAALRPGR